MIAYNADDVSLFGYLYHYPASEGKAGEMVKVYDWDSGVSYFASIGCCRQKQDFFVFLMS